MNQRKLMISAVVLATSVMTMVGGVARPVVAATHHVSWAKKPFSHDPAMADLAKRTVVKNKLSGSLLVVRDNKPVLYQAYGHTLTTPNQALNVQSKYEMASIQKNLTAIMLMRALADHHLTLDTTVSHFLPSLPNAKKITMRQLLTMTSNYHLTKVSKEDLDEEAYLNFDMQHIQIKQTPKWRYEAGNYDVIAMILRQLQGKSYDDQFNALYNQHQGYNFQGYDAFTKSPYYTESQKETGQHYAGPAMIYNREIGTGAKATSVVNMYEFLEDELHGKLLSKTAWQNMTKTNGNEQYASGLYHQADGSLYLHGLIQGYEPTIKTSRDGHTMVIWFSNRMTQKTHANVAFAQLMFRAATE